MSNVAVMFESIVAATAILDKRIRPTVVETPLLPRPVFDRPGLNTFGKLENRQPTGSFKLRGATAKLQSLRRDELAKGVVTASTGNHGAAVAHAAGLLGVSVQVFVSEDADERKIATIRDLGATITALPGDPVVAEVAARSAAAVSGQVYVPPYNDPTVVSGQGTTALELLRQIEPLDAVVVSVGGGGLISGIAATIKANSSARIVGASASNSAAMHHSVAAGRIVDVDHKATLSDGTAGGVEANSMTFEMCRTLVDDWVLVDEDQIISAMARYMENYADVIEGSAAVALAAIDQVPLAGNVVVIVCGGNVAAETLTSLGLGDC